MQTVDEEIELKEMLKKINDLTVQAVKIRDELAQIIGTLILKGML